MCSSLEKQLGLFHLFRTDYSHVALILLLVLYINWVDGENMSHYRFDDKVSALWVRFIIRNLIKLTLGFHWLVILIHSSLRVVSSLALLKELWNGTCITVCC